MEHIYLLAAYAKIRQNEMLRAGKRYRTVKELQRGDRGLRAKILPRLGATLFALGGKVKEQKRTQVPVREEEGVGSEVNLWC